jgi:hypothetical protein
MTALANVTGSFGAFVSFLGLLARVGMVRLWHTKEVPNAQCQQDHNAGHQSHLGVALALGMCKHAAYFFIDIITVLG